MGYSALAPVDRFMERHRFGSSLAPRSSRCGRAAAALFPAVRLQSDEPAQPEGRIDLRPFSTCAAIRAGANAIDVLTPNTEAAPQSPSGCGRCPRSRGSRRIESFVPTDQEAKLALIASSAETRPGAQPAPAPPPTDADNVAALKAAVTILRKAADEAPGPAPARSRRKRLAEALTKLADADQAPRDARPGGDDPPLQDRAQRPARIRRGAADHPTTIPREVASDWVTTDGRATRRGASQGRSRTTTKRCASSPARCWRSSPKPSAARSRFWNREIPDQSFIQAGSGRWSRSPFCCGSCCGASATCC